MLSRGFLGQEGFNKLQLREREIIKIIKTQITRSGRFGERREREREREREGLQYCHIKISPPTLST